MNQVDSQTHFASTKAVQHNTFWWADQYKNEGTKKRKRLGLQNVVSSLLVQNFVALQDLFLIYTICPYTPNTLNIKITGKKLRVYGKLFFFLFWLRFSIGHQVATQNNAARLVLSCAYLVQFCSWHVAKPVHIVIYLKACSHHGR